MILSADGHALEVTAIDISSGGVKLSCDKSVALKLLSGKHCSPGRIQGMETTVEISLADWNTEQKYLKARCRIVNFYRKAENWFEFGCQFVNSDKAQLSLITSHMAVAGRPGLQRSGSINLC